ncbi:MAG: hypothetical protein KJ000_20850 [Pirellulaceae bacterium]|nr:hypothetical protein [Pirellulaceae bacterium]
MPVEIAILSGAQQGGRWATEASRVVVGDTDSCDIRFDGDSDSDARGKRGVLLLHDDGWRFENQGSGSWLVNQTTVTPGQDCRLRSGDVVRLSEDGPDLRFTMLTAREYATHIASDASIPERSPSASSSSVPQPAPSVDLPDLPAVADSRVPKFAGIVVAVLLLVGLVFGLGAWPTRDAPPVTVTNPDDREHEAPGETAVVEAEGDAARGISTAGEPEPPTTADPAPSVQVPASASEPSGAPDAVAIQAVVADAMVYLMVEINGQKFPVCCGWAAAPDLVVSTGVPIAVLAEMLEQGQAVFAAYGDRNPSFVPVEALIVHPLFDKDEANSSVSRAHNVGIATLKASLPKHCQLERASALPKPPTGMELAVVAYALTTEPDLVPFNVLDPPRLRSMSVRIAGLETLSGATNDLPLIRLQGDAPSGMEGSPVFTAEGKVIGVLGGSAENRHAVLCDQLEPLLP